MLRIQVSPQKSALKHPKIALVGQAPGSEELLRGIPFIGPAGQELDRELQRAGVNRGDCYVTNVVKRRIPNDEIKPMYLDAACSKPGEELAEWWKYLENELKEVNPNVIIPLGHDALVAVCGLVGIGKYRGSIVPSYWGAKCVPTYHPSGVLQNWEFRTLVLRDLRKGQRESIHKEIILPKRDFIIAPTLKDVKLYLAECKKRGIASVDIETQWSTRISCIGFSYHPSSAICVPFFCEEGDYWGDEIAEVKREINGVLSDPSVKIVGQNFFYDRCWLERDGYEIKNFWFDTMIAQHSAWAQMPKDLATLASIFTDEPYWKDEGKDAKRISDWNRYYKYNCKDCAVTLECVAPLQNEIEQQGVKETFDFEMSLVPHFVKQTLRGIRFDTELRNEFKKATRDELAKVEAELDALLPESWSCVKCHGEKQIEFGRRNKEGVKQTKECPECKGIGRHINAKSPLQLKDLIYGHLKLPAQVKKGKQKTDEDAIIKLQAKHPNPIFQKIINIRGLSNRLGFLKVKIDPDKRIRTTLSCTTYTGRLASSGSPFGTGRNLQNTTHQSDGPKVSKNLPLRRLFIADEGMILFGPDYSKAEAYVMGYESGDPAYIEALEKGDIHTKNASVIFNCNQKDVTHDMRQLGKRACHGLNYMMGDLTLCDYVIKEMGPSYAITMREAKSFREAYFETYKGLREFQERIKRQIEDTRTLVNSYGRKCVFLGRPAGKTIREAVAFIPQSTVGDLCNRALKKVGREVPEVQFLLQIHDQLLLQGRREDCDTLVGRIIESMTMSIEAYYTGLVYTIPVEMKVGENWEDLK